MKFYVINKPKGSYSVEAKDIKEASTKTTSNPFMIVAADYVKDGEIYQAIQTKPDTVLLNKKPRHEFVSAATISEALRMSTTEEEEETPADVTEAIANVVTSEKPTFVGNYKPTGSFVAIDNDIEVSYQAADVKDPSVIMNDLARFLGSLHEKGINTVTCGSKEYSWDPNGILKGSNFVDENGTTLISVIVAAMKSQLATGEASGFLEINGKTVTYTVKIITPTVEEDKETEDNE